MTPAERLRAAADTIERVAQFATPGPWTVPTPTQPGYRYGAVVSADAPCDDQEREGYGGALIGESMLSGNRAHVALWDPPTALLAVELLRYLAASPLPATAPGLRAIAGDLADAILAGAEVSS